MDAFLKRSVSIWLSDQIDPLWIICFGLCFHLHDAGVIRKHNQTTMMIKAFSGFVYKISGCPSCKIVFL